ncbi:MAG: hypothetical protein IPP34_16915 [Bacteroidetes bacterium]|nr:hypothetical protein [Bacteroidota bacterium]
MKDIALTLGPNTKYNVIGGSMYAVVLSSTTMVYMIIMALITDIIYCIISG